MTLPTTVAEDWIDQVFAAVETHVLQSGWFDSVNTVEPKNLSGNGVHCGIWVQDIEALQGASGLKTSSALLTFNVRCFSSMLQEPQGSIDPNLLKAVSSLMRKFHGNFDFGLHPLVRNVDLLGEFGIPLRARAGYLTIAKVMYRIMTITLPIVINDVWEQVP